MDRTVEQWVDYIQTLHFREIDLSLDRVQKVFDRLYPRGVAFSVISLAGTNGKGSTAAMLSSIYVEGGKRVGKFTSPHLVRFNERIQINNQHIEDKALANSFQRVEAAREQTPLTYFEFGTLVAIDVFSIAGVDVAIMEVGLGGRLDAVNVLDADVAIVTSVSIDHSAWLGDTREKIGREKIGIARSFKPCVIGMVDPPNSVIEYCRDENVDLHQIGRDFTTTQAANSEQWCFESGDLYMENIARPFNQSGVQLSNAALAIQAVQMLSSLKVSSSAIKEGIAKATLAGRCQLLSKQPWVVLDVSHNVESVQRLADFAESLSFKGELRAVCGMLKDKEVSESLECLAGSVEQWYFATIDDERGSSANEMHHSLKLAQNNLANAVDDSQVRNFDNVMDAYREARLEMNSEDCLLVFGSFFVVGDIIRASNLLDTV